MGCFFANGEVQIKDLFVIEKYRNKGIEQFLMEKVNEYAKEKNAEQIITYLGPEPFCPDGQIEIGKERRF